MRDPSFPGTDPTDSRVIIISGHFDSRATLRADFTSDAPGANDDGSGTVLAMEAARLMSQVCVILMLYLFLECF